MESTHQKAQTDLAQFYGQMVNANFIPLWQSHAEPKHRFFEQLLLHRRALTAKSLLLRHWPCEWICCLCYEAFETWWSFGHDLVEYVATTYFISEVEYRSKAYSSARFDLMRNGYTKIAQRKQHFNILIGLSQLYGSINTILSQCDQIINMTKTITKYLEVPRMQQKIFILYVTLIDS